MLRITLPESLPQIADIYCQYLDILYKIKKENPGLGTLLTDIPDTVEEQEKSKQKAQEATILRVKKKKKKKKKQTSPERPIHTLTDASTADEEVKVHTKKRRAKKTHNDLDTSFPLKEETEKLMTLFNKVVRSDALSPKSITEHSQLLGYYLSFMAKHEMHYDERDVYDFNQKYSMLAADLYGEVEKLLIHIEEISTETYSKIQTVIEEISSMSPIRKAMQLKFLLWYSQNFLIQHLFYINYESEMLCQHHQTNTEVKIIPDFNDFYVSVPKKSLQHLTKINDQQLQKINKRLITIKTQLDTSKVQEVEEELLKEPNSILTEVDTLLKSTEKQSEEYLIKFNRVMTRIRKIEPTLVLSIKQAIAIALLKNPVEITVDISPEILTAKTFSQALTAILKIDAERLETLCKQYPCFSSLKAKMILATREGHPYNELQCTYLYNAYINLLKIDKRVTTSKTLHTFFNTDNDNSALDYFTNNASKIQRELQLPPPLILETPTDQVSQISRNFEPEIGARYVQGTRNTDDVTHERIQQIRANQRLLTTDLESLNELQKILVEQNIFSKKFSSQFITLARMNQQLGILLLNYDEACKRGLTESSNDFMRAANLLHIEMNQLKDTLNQSLRTSVDALSQEVSTKKGLLDEAINTFSAQFNTSMPHPTNKEIKSIKERHSDSLIEEIIEKHASFKEQKDVYTKEFTTFEEELPAEDAGTLTDNLKRLSVHIKLKRLVDEMTESSEQTCHLGSGETITLDILREHYFEPLEQVRQESAKTFMSELATEASELLPRVEHALENYNVTELSSYLDPARVQFFTETVKKLSAEPYKITFDGYALQNLQKFLSILSGDKDSPDYINMQHAFFPTSERHDDHQEQVRLLTQQLGNVQYRFEHDIKRQNIIFEKEVLLSLEEIHTYRSTLESINQRIMDLTRQTHHRLSEEHHSPLAAYRESINTVLTELDQHSFAIPMAAEHFCTSLKRQFDAHRVTNSFEAPLYNISDFRGVVTRFHQTKKNPEEIRKTIERFEEKIQRIEGINVDRSPISSQATDKDKALFLLQKMHDLRMSLNTIEGELKAAYDKKHTPENKRPALVLIRNLKNAIDNEISVYLKDNSEHCHRQFISRVKQNIINKESILPSAKEATIVSDPLMSKVGKLFRSIKRWFHGLFSTTAEDRAEVGATNTEQRVVSAINELRTNCRNIGINSQNSRFFRPNPSRNCRQEARNEERHDGQRPPRPQGTN